MRFLLPQVIKLHSHEAGGKNCKEEVGFQQHLKVKGGNQKGSLLVCCLLKEKKKALNRNTEGNMRKIKE